MTTLITTLALIAVITFAALVPGPKLPGPNRCRPEERCQRCPPGQRCPGF